MGMINPNSSGNQRKLSLEGSTQTKTPSSNWIKNRLDQLGDGKAITRQKLKDRIDSISKKTLHTNLTDLFHMRYPIKFY